MTSGTLCSFLPISELCPSGVFEQDRLKALNEQDTEAYYNLLKEHKNEKILNVLQQTDKYLRSLGLAVSFSSASRASLLLGAEDRTPRYSSCAKDYRSGLQATYPTKQYS